MTPVFFLVSAVRRCGDRRHKPDAGCCYRRADLSSRNFSLVRLYRTVAVGDSWVISTGASLRRLGVQRSVSSNMTHAAKLGYGLRHCRCDSGQA